MPHYNLNVGAFRFRRFIVQENFSGIPPGTRPRAARSGESRVSQPARLWLILIKHLGAVAGSQYKSRSGAGASTFQNPRTFSPRLLRLCHAHSGNDIYSHGADRIAALGSARWRTAGGFSFWQVERYYIALPLQCGAGGILPSIQY
jgi:hypothetical protein